MSQHPCTCHDPKEEEADLSKVDFTAADALKATQDGKYSTLRAVLNQIENVADVGARNTTIHFPYMDGGFPDEVVNALREAGYTVVSLVPDAEHHSEGTPFNARMRVTW